MAFGQPSGPPASARQVQELLALLRDAGHADLRDARGPLGLTQRQAAGKFTREEADALIARLQDDTPSPGEETLAAAEAVIEAAAARATAPAVVRARTVPARLSASEEAIRRIPDDRLRAEAERRGWTVRLPPSADG